MHVISLSKFRTNQTEVLLRAIQGESVLLTSRLGAFKLTPVTTEEKIVTRISEGLSEVKLIEAGELPAKSAKTFLDEL
ncbi:prevent-host-death protein [Bacteroides fragilis]|jgi:antitoxin (DNA-binding transcriptional repressor) of toxin-antitoxin stability system|uniref:prevent-host-death protein n=1 Tax=Bacteroides fragilis TaxID=817 RepID=UPI0035617487